MAVTNLALQKLMFFAHGQHMLTDGRPLVNGYFEAWRYGPVHPLVYQAFKETGDAPIRKRATAFNFLTGEEKPIPTADDQQAVDVLDRILSSLGRLSVGRLIEISHAARGPWAETVNRSGTESVLGVRISDRIILERFRFLMVPVQDSAPAGDPREDSPLT
ncbi:MAG: Panacea domain-containing protein [Caulobacterales bacterium]